MAVNIAVVAKSVPERAETDGPVVARIRVRRVTTGKEPDGTTARRDSC